MYFPYLRGRQYELLALKELAQKELISNLIIPVVEPIKITSTFNSTIKIYNDMNLPLALIMNPCVGNIVGDNTNKLLTYITDNIIPSVIIDDSAKDFINKNIEISELIAILTSRDYAEEYKDLFIDTFPKYSLCSDERQIRRAVTNNKVLFEDKFIKQIKNSDYINCDDEFFSEDHIYYKDEGYCGFGDYSIVGNNYEESGFSPRAVAIHIVYFAKDNTLRIHHFVSDSNYGIEDVAGKFYEAVSKLSIWSEKLDHQQYTFALSTLLDYANKGYYPGLPTIKKLSIMHHLELINKYLSGEVQ